MNGVMSAMWAEGWGNDCSECIERWGNVLSETWSDGWGMQKV